MAFGGNARRQWSSRASGARRVVLLLGVGAVAVVGWAPSADAHNPGCTVAFHVGPAHQHFACTGENEDSKACLLSVHVMLLKFDVWCGNDSGGIRL